MCLVREGACHTDMDIIMSGIIGRQSQRSMIKLTGQTEKALVGHVTHPRLFCDRVQLAVGLDPFACRKAHSSRSNKTGLVYPERCLDRGVEGRDSTGAKRRRANEDASWRGVKGREKCGAKTFGVRALVPTFFVTGVAVELLVLLDYIRTCIRVHLFYTFCCFQRLLGRHGFAALSHELQVAKKTSVVSDLEQE